MERHANRSPIGVSTVTTYTEKEVKSECGVREIWLESNPHPWPSPFHYGPGQRILLVWVKYCARCWTGHDDYPGG